MLTEVPFRVICWFSQTQLWTSNFWKDAEAFSPSLMDVLPEESIFGKQEDLSCKECNLLLKV